MYRFILIICLMGELFMIHAAKSRAELTKKYEEQNRNRTSRFAEPDIKLSGTGKEKHVEDFVSDIPMIERFFTLSQLSVEQYIMILLLQELNLSISDIEEYMELTQSSFQDTQKRMEELEKSNPILRKIKIFPDLIVQKELEQLYFKREFALYNIDNLDSLAVLNKSWRHSNQCLNAETNLKHAITDSEHLKKLHDICLSFKNTLQKIMPLETLRLDMPDYKICNDGIKCSDYYMLMNQIRDELDTLTLVNVNDIGNTMTVWRRRH